MKKSNLLFIKIQLIVFIYALVSLFSKISSNIMVEKGVFSIDFILSIATMFFLLAIYALFWQKILKKTNLSYAYINKATQLIWSLLWAVLIFNERITIFNIIGTFIVLIGIYLVNSDEKHIA